MSRKVGFKTYDQDQLSLWPPSYDDLDRLTNAQVLGQIALTLTYAPNNNGNIEQKSDAGIYLYNQQKPHAIDMLQGPVYPPAHSQYVNYTPFKKVADITEGDAQLYLNYGPDQQRQWAAYYMAGALEKTRIYTNGLYEEDRDADGNLLEQRSYIMANGKPVAALVQDASGDAELQYLYTDYLGSLLLTTDENGNPLHEQNFDAWGNHRDPHTWQALSGQQQAQTTLGERGYTFHEHLPQFALVNMNGRVYDPVLGRFLSPDPYVQAPTNTQNYNRYSYVLNNPLKYTDPSGNSFLGNAFGGIFNSLWNGINNAIDWFLSPTGFANWAFGPNSFANWAFGANSLFSKGIGTIWNVTLGLTLSAINLVVFTVSVFVIPVGTALALSVFGDGASDIGFIAGLSIGWFVVWNNVVPWQQEFTMSTWSEFEYGGPTWVTHN